MQKDINIGLKIEDIISKGNIEKVKALIEEGVQAALEKLEEY